MQNTDQLSQSDTIQAEYQSRGFERSLASQTRFNQVIPGGAHTYAKGDDQYPQFMPVYLSHGRGCQVWDVDGNEFIEFGMGLRTVTLGHAYPAVVEAAYSQMKRGLNFSRPSILELECAEKLLSLLPGADMVKFAKNGSDATTAAVKLARAYTSREVVAICLDQPFFSVDDWFICQTAMDAGIPQSTKKLTVGFRYNDIESVRKLFDAYPSQIAALIMEAETSVPPADGYLESVQGLCHRNGTVFILDEMITGFRWPKKFAQHAYNLKPDLTCIGKGFGNGFAISALAGRRELMQLGGLDHAFDRPFLLSTTHGAETSALAAAVAVMDTYEKNDVIASLEQSGSRLKTAVRKLTDNLGISEYFEVLGRSANLVFATRDKDKKPSQEFRTLFMQECLKNGVLAPSFVVSFSHTDGFIDIALERMSPALTVYKSALEDGVVKYLQGRPVKPVFRRRN